MTNRSSAGRSRLGLWSFACVLLAGGLSQAQTPPVVAGSGLSILTLDAPRSPGKDPPPIVDEGLRTPSNPRAQGPIVHPSFNIDPALVAEVEPNGTSATATPLLLTAGGAHVYGNIYPNGDLDFYSFTAAAGDRVYAATQTSASASASNDSVLELYASDGTTILEGDEDDGSFGTLSSSIAGTTIPAAGTYYLRVKHNSATVQLRPYQLYFQLRSGAPTAETEPNDTFPGQALPAGAWVSGAVASATDVDFYSIALNAGDTVFLSLDQDPERNGDANLRLGLGVFDTQILLVNDSGAGFAPYTAPDSEAYFMTVKDAGTYSIYVDTSAAATFGTYHLSATVFPRVTSGVNCTTYTSTNVPVAIPDNGGSITSTLTVPGNPRIADINVAIQGTHAFMGDLDVHLISPANNDVGLFTDTFNSTTGGRSLLDVVIDDEAAIPPSFQNSGGVRLQPELNYRLAWFDGENAGGTWTLQVRDDAAGDVGSITGWSIEVCEPPPPPACAPGFVPQTVYTTDFEAGAAGFTHSGTQDEWELGLPATVATTAANPVAPFNSCNSGTNCWKTDLDNTYNTSSTQDLLSPAINLAGLSPPVVVSWAHRYQMDTATNDHYFVSIQPVATPASAVRLFEHLDAVMTDAVGAPAVNIGASAGWGVVRKRADTLAGQNAELVFHLDSGTGATNFGGAAIDDVTVTACRAASADLSITKTDGVTTAVPGGSVTYTITASNAGVDPVTGATVADTFPASLTCTWTCVGAGGGTCTASGAGNISDAVNLPVGASVTYTASCAVNASATGTLSNTATVSSTITDPSPANNSATDTDTLTPQANLGITKTDGVTTATPGGSVTYTITASNPGPSNAPGATVADTFPASLTCTWTCVGAGGGTCTASGAGNISDAVNLPAGGSTTYTASCTINASATGTLSNTATVAAPGGVTDPTPGNNSATDTDTLTPQANLGITKTDGVTTATPGGSVTYTITASNAGPSNASGATVADTFPASLTCTWTCVGAGGGTCTASGSGNISDTVNLPSGGSATYTASCSISGAATGTLSNTATVAAPAGVTDPTPGNNSATDTDTLAASADLSITKTDGVTTATPGGSVTYTITSSNAGPSNATGATVADTFPASLTCTWTCVGAGGGTCTASGSGNINGTVNLPSGGSVTYTASCTISASATGSLTNTATVAAPAGVTDPTPGNNSATDTDTLGASADLSITKTDGVASVTAGGTTTYTIIASNAGPSSATGATVADTFPASLTCTWTCVGAGGGTCTASGSGNINNTVNLPSGGSVTYTASCNVALAATGTLSNTATVAAPAGTTDPTPGNNSATDTDTINAAGANVAGTKTVGGTFTPGASITYTVVLTNSGGPQADNPGNEFTDVLPANLTLVSATATSGTAVASVGTNTVTWNGALPLGGTVTITINATISPSATGTVSNQGTIAYDSDANNTNDATRQTDDPAAGGASDPTVFTIGGASADLSITKTDGVTSATPGGTTTYTITASNAGPSSITGATVTDTFPAALTCTWTCTGAGGGTCAASGSGNIADTVNLPVGGSVTYAAACTISASASGTLANTASVAAPAGANDPNPGNNSATDTDTLGASADLSITKTDSVAGVLAGGTLTYTIVVGNAGPSSVVGATVGDTFPAACTAPTWTCAAAGGASCPASGAGSIAANVDVPVGGTATFTATCPVAAATPNGTVVTNTATVAAPAGTTDPTPANNSATDTTTVAVGAVLAATKTVAGATFQPGSAVTYTIALTNGGGGPQNDNPGDELTDVLPAGLTLVSATATGGTAVANVGTNTVTWNGALAAGGSVTIAITATINVGASGTIANQATLAYDGDANNTNESTGVSDDPVVGGATDPTVFVVVGITPATPVPALGTWALLLTALGLVALAARRRKAWRF